MICTVYAKVGGELELVYDKAVDYFKALGFNLKQNVKPTKLVFERGSVLFADVGILRDKFKTKRCELEVNLAKEKEDVTIRCDYYVPWIISSKSRDLEEINKEIKGLENFITLEEKFCESCKRKIAQKGLYCPYCGKGLK